MKIYNWIDSLFDSYEKRSSILVIFCMMYIAWQTIWQAVFMWDAVHVINVESLFSLFSNLDVYEPSCLISMALESIGQNGFTLASIYHSISFFDFLMIGFGILGFMKSEHKLNWRDILL